MHEKRMDDVGFLYDAPSVKKNFVFLTFHEIFLYVLAQITGL